jgi:hypothetical protein
MRSGPLINPAEMRTQRKHPIQGHRKRERSRESVNELLVIRTDAVECPLLAGLCATIDRGAYLFRTSETPKCGRGAPNLKLLQDRSGPYP